jgi:hypothetical protein
LGAPLTWAGAGNFSLTSRTRLMPRDHDRAEVAGGYRPPPQGLGLPREMPLSARLPHRQRRY